MDVQGETVDRRRFLVAGGALAAAGTVGAWVAAPGIAEATNNATVTLTPGSGNGIANRAAIQAALRTLATQPGDGMLELPSGTYEVDMSPGSILLEKSVTIAGAGSAATVLDVVPKVFTASHRPLIEVTSGAHTSHAGYTVPAAGSSFVLRDLRIDGPTSYALTDLAAAFQWSHNGSLGRVRAERLVITGLFAAGIVRAGKGITEVIDCDINAAEAPVKVFESSNSPDASECVILRGHHTGFDGKGTSIGLYIHPNVSLYAQGVHYEHFGRFAFYSNGNSTLTSPPRYWHVVDCEVERANLAQTGAHAQSKFVRVKHHGARTSGGESVIWGDVDFISCDLRNEGQYSYAQGAGEKNFVDCWLEPGSYLVSAGTGTTGTTRFVGCTWKLVGTGRTFNFNSASNMRVVVVDSTVRDCAGASYQALNMGAGQLDVLKFTVDSPRTDHGVYITSNVVQTGAITYANTGTCPTSP